MSLTNNGVEGYNNISAVAIASGETDSAAFGTGGMVFCGVFIPAAFTGTSISFLAAPDADSDFVPVSAGADGSLLSYTVSQGSYCAVDPKDFAGLSFLKIVSGSAEADDRTLSASLKGF